MRIRNGDVYAWSDVFGDVHIDVFAEKRLEENRKQGKTTKQILETSETIKLVMRKADVLKLFID